MTKKVKKNKNTSLGGKNNSSSVQSSSSSSAQSSSSSSDHGYSVKKFGQSKSNDKYEQVQSYDEEVQNDLLSISSDYHAYFKIKPENNDGNSIVDHGKANDGVHRRKRFASSIKIGNVDIVDHPSLSNPSSHVQFGQEDQTIVFVNNFEQITLEKKNERDTLTAKQASLASPGLLMLRAVCTLMAFMMAGIIFIFCLNIVLFLFMGLAIETGLVSQRERFNLFAFIGVLLSIPVFTSGLSQVMVIAQAFVVDTWNGGKFLKTTLTWDNTSMHWIPFCILFGFPVLVASILLCMRETNWLTITSLFWFSSVFLYYIFFFATVIYYELSGCFDLIRYHPKLRNLSRLDGDETCFKTFRRAIKLKLMQRYSGYETISFIAHKRELETKLTYSEISRKHSNQSFVDFYSRMTMSLCMSPFYIKYDEPVRSYNVNEVLEHTPYVTNSSWGLEMIYFRDRSANFIAIVEGEAALSKQQVSSSIACFVIGTVMTWFAIVGILGWFRVSITLIVVISIAYVILSYNSIRSSIGINSVYRSVLNQNEKESKSQNPVDTEQSKHSNAIYQVRETFRLTEPTSCLFWTLFWLDLIAFIFIPIIALLSARNYRVAALFIFVSIIFTVRSLINAPASFRELGSLDGIEVNNKVQTPRAEWREKHRLGKILSEISVGKKSKLWTRIFLSFISFFGFMFLLAAMQDNSTDAYEDTNYTTLDLASPEFKYKQPEIMPYGSCSLIGDSSKYGQLADFAFLAALSYYKEEESSKALFKWFEGEAFELHDKVVDFQRRRENYDGAIATGVTYKLFDFPNEKTKVVSIRGTQTSLDTLVDIQLWMPAVLAQVLRAISPLGEFFTPVLPHLVKFVSMVEDKALEDVSYYREIVEFVKELMEEDQDCTVRIVGHSLGGGIALIAAAQLQVSGIGLSAVNTMLSRMTFDPIITTDALNKYTFNIIPDRDIVPRIDDHAQNYQRIKCRGNGIYDDLGSCHSFERAICEILYTCGSSGRPVPCDCVNLFGFDVPESDRGLKFDSDCPISE